MYISLQDLKDVSKDSGNPNPGIFLLDDMKTINEQEQAFAPTNVQLDEDGDLVIFVDKKMLQEKIFEKD